MNRQIAAQHIRQIATQQNATRAMQVDARIDSNSISVPLALRLNNLISAEKQRDSTEDIM